MSIKDRGKWVDELSSVLWAYRTYLKEATGETPFSLIYGIDAVIPAEIAIDTHRVQFFDEIQNEKLSLEALDMITEKREDAFLRMEMARSRMKGTYDSRVIRQNFQVGDLVLRKEGLGKNLGKLGATCEGPFRVVVVLASGGYQLETLEGVAIPRTWNEANLKKFYV